MQGGQRIAAMPVRQVQDGEIAVVIKFQAGVFALCKAGKRKGAKQEQRGEDAKKGSFRF